MPANQTQERDLPPEMLDKAREQLLTEEQLAALAEEESYADEHRRELALDAAARTHAGKPTDEVIGAAFAYLDFLRGDLDGDGETPEHQA